MKHLRFGLFAAILTAVMSVGFRPVDSGLQAPANMYLYDTLLLISDESLGVHVYSVADASQPRQICTIPISGNSGAAMKDDVIYANSWDAIGAFRLHADGSFDTLATIHGQWYGCCVNDVAYDRGGFSCFARPVVYDVATGGTGGSYAIFAVIDTFLYYIDYSHIITLSIAKADAPRELSRTWVDGSIETLFPTEKHLYIGGTLGMYVMDRSDPAQPKMIGIMQHFKSCDPVVVADTVAYVTLRGGSSCGGTRDVLLSVTVADPRNPRILQERAVAPPYGLSVCDSLLYVSIGTRGFELYNIADPSNMLKVAGWASPETRDFIWSGNRLYIMSVDKVSIFDVTNPAEPVAVASID